MNTAADNLEVTDALETAVSEQTAADTRSGLLPFGFSQAKQVVLEPSEDGLTLSYVGQLDTETLLEVRRTAASLAGGRAGACCVALLQTMYTIFVLSVHRGTHASTR
mgnify:CR=1 FL=1